MRSIALIALLLVTSCGKAPQVDPVLLPYLQRYEQETGTSLANISATFVPTLRPVVAQCVNGTQIQVDRAFYDSLTDLGREQMLYHEIGHCAKGLDHDNSTVYYKNSWIPASIMHLETFGEAWYYAELRNTYKAALREGRAIRQEELQ